MKRGDILVTRWGARFKGRRFPCAIGRGGTTCNKCEGDGATPVGVHRIVATFARADRTVGRRAKLAPKAIGPADLWSDDIRDPRYNHHVRVPHRFGHEQLRRSDPQYDLILVTDWNWPLAVPGKGSAIFVHIWRRPRSPTAGCVAFASHDLLWIVGKLNSRTRLVVRG
ncbi:MAG: hypothetical protein DI533_19140 [Cereibacter sphaeroides]|uniref:L,D-TPase catalytic domain-containing protein n=1 Tax=Cereibacter sphaeroides TaxID=1063 RepID=A0A2W5S8J8_CERSP|nr:MAG: hypothetical protein DI533_19140 [Cereibacter sphaeroides]